MVEKVARVGVKKQEGYLYFVDKNGHVAKTKMSRGGRTKGKAKIEVVAQVGVKKKSGYLYFIDKQGDISAVKIVRGQKKRQITHVTYLKVISDKIISDKLQLFIFLFVLFLLFILLILLVQFCLDQA